MLTTNFGSGWGEKHIRHCLRIAETIDEEQIVYAVCRQLSWTHLRTISYEENPLKRLFYIEMAINQRWNTRKLADEIDNMLYERTAIAKQPEEQVRLALQELQTKDVINPDLFFKSTYVLDFLGLKNTYSEKDLESALVGNLEQFIMELGNGFAFMERQMRYSIRTENQQLFASRYRLYLPKEEELKQLIERDRINFELGNQ